ncbi:hypothetical protein [Pontiella agarivorans]|uniref:ATPase dynein-related AAA domain-containing protein n=1 Tax=Pontiella agarivorans TaxID=3038953 RepID=A0ABU5N0M3_9BACT|nr:hypothetical protein [Pontiella agarivorans]MDZ8119985.1 hypothetical protein [Pontiella agarivorans]
MTNLPFTLLLSLWLVVSFISVGILAIMWRLPKFWEFKNLQGKCSELEQRYKLLEPEVEQGARMAAQLKQDTANVELLKTQVEKLEHEKQQLEPIGQKVAELESKLVTKHDELNQTAAEEKTLREEIIRLESVKKSEEEGIETRKKAVEELSKEIESLNKRFSELRKNIPLAESELVSLKQHQEHVTGDIIRVESQLKELRNSHDEVKKDLDKMTEKYSYLKGESQALEKEIEARTKHLEALKADHKNAGGVNETDDPMGDLWSPNFVFSQTPRVSNEANEESRMRDLSKNLENRGLVFADRTLNAFHTALKVADISPLTVLSGISGTGKSLLPRAYSDAMGIHFLGLAVQPRWDSPQDMFGFYNYMEQKYKATELARAMVQFERYNKLAHGGDLKDQMMLVLLDEMNLARVEYYFSEFLSKLEIRRDVDPAKLTDRQKVEIALEMGHGSKGIDEVRLYPDRNILFVGTMNEDESTQNLSDKVLDRSCVLRFGKPKQLQTNQAKGSAFSAAGPDGMLPRDTWMKWTDLGDNTPSVYTVDVIEQLNDVLNMTGKPFAHRVGKAIGNYVLSYPDWISGREKIALADQVEQRILPKLRGLDVNEHHDAFSKLSTILADLEDPVLSAAFEEGRQSNHSRGMNSFIWRGVDRCEN